MLIGPVALICLFVGYFARELKETLKRIQKALYVLIQREEKQQEKEKKMGYAGPMTMEELKELDDEAQINALNQQ